MKKNSEHYSKIAKKIANRIEKQRSKATQGDFFFAKFLTVNGKERKSPVFVVGKDHDDQDVIICSCTSQPPKTRFDIKVQLKRETYVRTNKIYTIQRDQLLFKIPQQPSNEQFKAILESVKAVFDI
ncbi:MAG: type II toxin-antitoxin system PemK/MazF family toxin [Peptococcaceae bacterium]|nr:type II toxin-antitoxin system PemK/MazF family toxin [Peptococcaceae bacterium]